MPNLLQSVFKALIPKRQYHLKTSYFLNQVLKNQFSSFE